MRMRFRGVSVRMAVHVVPMNVGMRMNDVRFFRRGSDRARRAQKTCNIHRTQDDQHEPHGKLHGEPDSRGNHHVKQDDGGAHDEYRESMADPPENAGECSFQQVTLAAYDRSHGDDVVGIGGVAHPEKKAHRDNRQKTDHDLRYLVRLPRPLVTHPNASSENSEALPFRPRSLRRA